MFHLYSTRRFLLCVAVLCGLLLTRQSAQAGEIYYRWAFAPATSCSYNAGSGVQEVTFASQPIEWLNIPVGATLRGVWIINGVEVRSGSSPLTPGTGSAIYEDLGILGSANYPMSVGITLQTIVGGNIIYTSTLSATCTADGSTSATVLNAAGVGAFSGPALPDKRNLVLIVHDTPVYSSPDGAPTTLSLKTCQTAFVLETSADGKWGRIFAMGGWIPVSATVDVAENYGQTSGQERLAGCENR